MRIFGRKPELDQLRARRTLLEKQLVTAERELAAAVEARQKALLEGDLDTPLDGQSANGLVGRLHDEKAAVLIALTTIDERIAEAENKLASERDLALRSAAAKELTAAADALDSVAVDLAAVANRLPGAMQRVLTRLPTKPVSKERVELFAAEVVAALQLIAREGRSHAVQVAAGNGTVCEPAAQEPAKPPAPAIERTPIFLLGPGRWLEPNGEVVTSGAYVVVSPPASIAARAIEFGHGVDPLSDPAVVLRQRCPPRYGFYPPEDCADLNEPKPDKLPAGSKTITEPLFHSEFSRARGGTASVARNSR